MTTGKRRSAQSTRKALRSPGRPPVARREHQRVFWSAIAAGRSSKDPSGRRRRPRSSAPPRSPTRTRADVRAAPRAADAGERSAFRVDLAERRFPVVIATSFIWVLRRTRSSIPARPAQGMHGACSARWCSEGLTAAQGRMAAKSTSTDEPTVTERKRSEGRGAQLCRPPARDRGAEEVRTTRCAGEGEPRPQAQGAR